jgi:hypothetical protein
LGYLATPQLPRGKANISNAKNHIFILQLSQNTERDNFNRSLNQYLNKTITSDKTWFLIKIGCDEFWRQDQQETFLKMRRASLTTESISQSHWESKLLEAEMAERQRS